MRMPWSGDKKNKEPKRRQSAVDLFFTRAKIHWLFLGAIFILAAFWIAFPMEKQRRRLNPDDFTLNEKSPQDVIAQLDISYYDEDATGAERRKAEIEVPPAFRLDFQRLENVQEEFSIVRQMRVGLLSFDSKYQIDLDTGNISAELQQEFENSRLLLGQDVRVSVEEDGNRWLITSDGKEVYIVKKEEDRLNVYLTDEEKVNRMRRRFWIGPSDAVGLILATVQDEELDSMERKVIETLSDILVKGVIPTEDSYKESFAENLSKINYIKPKWERIRKELEKELGYEPTNADISRRMSVTLVDARSESVAEKTVSVEELLYWHEATNAVKIEAAKLEGQLGAVVEEMCVELMRPNLEYDPVYTQKSRVKLLADLPKVSRIIPKGDKIVGIGDVVTEPIKKKLESMSRAQMRALLLAIPGALLLSALLLFVIIIYLKRFEPSVFSQPRKILALDIAILLVLVVGNLIIISGPELNIERPGFLIPATLAPIIIAMLVNVQLAIIITCVIGVLIAMLAGVNMIGALEYFLVIFAGGLAGVMSTSRARHRRHLITAGVYVSAANVIAILGLGLLENLSPINLGKNCLIGAANGAMVAVLIPGLLPIFEYLSRTTTDMELLELADLNQPLLTQLKGRTGGTYYHSLDIAKLAETAAEAVGASPLLARVGSYYHDIGKTAKPENFIENQKGENVHDNLNPRMSVRVIAQHVKDGVRLAKENKLPQVVIDMIEQHHGTTLIGGLHFYQKATEADKHNSVRLEDFRYPGPKPQTKEAAILFLADSVESARRVMLNGSPTYSRLVSFVREIAEGKIMDLQLDECDLTLRDIRSITEAFVRVLSGMYHTRIEYPKNEQTVKISGEQNGSEDRKTPRDTG